MRRRTEDSDATPPVDRNDVRPVKTERAQTQVPFNCGWTGTGRAVSEGVSSPPFRGPLFSCTFPVHYSPLPFTHFLPYSIASTPSFLTPSLSSFSPIHLLASSSPLSFRTSPCHLYLLLVPLLLQLPLSLVLLPCYPPPPPSSFTHLSCFLPPLLTPFFSLLTLIFTFSDPLTFPFSLFCPFPPPLRSHHPFPPPCFYFHLFALHNTGEPNLFVPSLSFPPSSLSCLRNRFIFDLSLP